MVDGSQVLEQIHAEGPGSAIDDDGTRPPGKPSTWWPTTCPTLPGVRLGLGIVYEPDLVSEEARKFTAAADVVVVAVGFNDLTEGEGHDRTFDCPGDRMR